MLGVTRKRRRFRAIVAMVCALALCSLFGTPAFSQAVSGCGLLSNSYGPFDYRVEHGQPLYLVEMAHFTPDVEMLIHGNTGQVIQDLDYTLRAFPNHYRALQSVMRYAFAGGSFGLTKPAECYFKRAVAFQPDDAAAHTIYGNYLLGCTRLKDATRRRVLECADQPDPGYMDPRVLKAARMQYEEALRLAPESPDVNYDAAIFYVDMNELKTAKRLANVAYGKGYPLTGLRKMLDAAEAGERRVGSDKAPPAPRSDH